MSLNRFIENEKSLELNEENVKHLYYTLKLSLMKTSKELNVPESRLHKFMKDNNIKRRTLSEARKNVKKEDNPMYGKKQSEEFKKQRSESWKGKNNPNYINDWNDLSTNAKHRRIKKVIERPTICPVCKLTKKLDLCNLNHEYNNIISEWKFMCSSCHKKYDIKNHLMPNPMVNLRK